LVYLEGTGLSGSFATRNADFGVQVQSSCYVDNRVTTEASIKKFTTYVASAIAIAYTGETGITDCAPPDCTYLPYPVNAGDMLEFDVLSNGSVSWAFTKTTDSGVTNLNSGTGTSQTYYYTITTADITSAILQFRIEAIATD